VKGGSVMKKIFIFSVVAAALFFGGMRVYSQAQVTEDHGKKIQEIQQLLNTMGTQAIQRQMMDMMFAGFRKDMPSVPKAFWDKAQVKMTAQLPELSQKLVVIYDEHFSEADIAGLISFYQTPVGKKYLQELPKVTQESYIAGSEWGKAIGEAVDQDLKKAGYE
jgi:hypothetical protein